MRQRSESERPVKGRRVNRPKTRKASTAAPSMPAEIRATVQLYLDGKIREWYSRGDGRGAIFLLNTKDVAEAHTIMDGLPLARENFLDHEYIAVGPLFPLRLLMAKPGAER